jgi:prepilin-type N-terminal cleavage/methylation domain-containing protein
MENIRKNKGFTLIELLVVIAMIAVSIGVAGIASPNTAMNNLRRCTSAADSLLARCRINSLHRAQPVFVEIDISGGNVVGRYFEANADGEFETDDDGNRKPIEVQTLGSSSNLTVIYTINGSETTLERDDPLRISFTRRGALIIVDEDGEVIDGRLTEIRFTNGSISYLIVITPETGARRVRAG